MERTSSMDTTQTSIPAQLSRTTMNSSNPPSINGSKSVLYPEQISFSDGRKFKTKVERVLIALIILFLITTVIFTCLFIVYYIRHEDSVAKNNICDSTDCVLMAGAIMKKMDMTVDPCEDFSQYACGTFNREAVVKKGKTRSDVFSMVSDDNLLVLKGFIAAPIEDGDSPYLVNMKRYYQSCFNEDQIEKVGLDPYLNSEYAKEFPTLNPNWDESTFDLNDVIDRYARVYVKSLYSFYVSTDLENTNVHVISLDYPSLGLSKEYMERERNDTVLVAFETYLREFAKVLGASEATAEQDAKDLLDIKIAISKFEVSKEEKRNSTRMYNPTTVKALGERYPYLGVPRALRAGFATANMTLDDDQVIINKFPEFLDNLDIFLRTASKRTIQNMFSFDYALTRVSSLTRKLRDVSLDFYRVYLGRNEEAPRWEDCTVRTANVFSTGASKQFVLQKFSEESKDYMNTMIDNLKTVFAQALEDNSWMTASTKQETLAKLEKMGRKIGYPDHKFEEADIIEKYENYTMSDDNYYNNVYVMYTQSNLRSLVKLHKPVDRTRWLMATYDVNAYFSWLDNEIVFPAGILQPPFYSPTFLDSMNYGAIGVVIGHEITHGFDDQGSQYDKDGNLRNWWQDEDRARFVNKTKCVVDQYSNFRLEEIDMNVNGVNTQGENVADNFGVKGSFQAYKAHVRKHGEQKRLPGLNLSQDQTFFLSFAQAWCEKVKKESLVMIALTESHPPGRFRIMGSVQNSEDFARAYSCPVGSPMNPAKKCSVW